MAEAFGVAGHELAINPRRRQWALRNLHATKPPSPRLRKSLKFLRKETLLGIARPSALHYGTGGTRGSPPDRPTIEGSVSSRDVEEIRKSPNPGTPGDVKLSNCMSST
jgi:hypothetical protein